MRIGEVLLRVILSPAAHLTSKEHPVARIPLRSEFTFDRDYVRPTDPIFEERRNFAAAVLKASEAERKDETIKAMTRIHFMGHTPALDTNIPADAFARVVLSDAPQNAHRIPRVTGHGKVKQTIVRAGAVAWIESL